MQTIIFRDSKLSPKNINYQIKLIKFKKEQINRIDDKKQILHDTAKNMHEHYFYTELALKRNFGENN